MLQKSDKNKARQKRHLRVRNHIHGTAERPRLNVYRSLKNIYVQVIDDERGVTLASASTKDKGFANYGGNIEAAKVIGAEIAKRAMERASRKLSSTVAATSIMAASQHLPRLLARQVLNSD